jgi:hypothetical protein
MLAKTPRSAPRPATLEAEAVREVVIKNDDQQWLGRTTLLNRDIRRVFKRAVRPATREAEIVREVIDRFLSSLQCSLRPVETKLARSRASARGRAHRLRRRGRPPGSDWVKIVVVANLVDALIELGFYRTRKRGNHARLSACSIVADALTNNKRFGSSIGEAAVEKIWEKYHALAADPLSTDSQIKSEK